jgi:hypothetical protein
MLHTDLHGAAALGPSLPPPAGAMPAQAPPESSGAGSAPHAPAPQVNTQQIAPHFADTDESRKPFATVAAALALKGYTLHRTDAGTFIVSKWNLARNLSNLGAVQAFASAVGASI